MCLLEEFETYLKKKPVGRMPDSHCVCGKVGEKSTDRHVIQTEKGQPLQKPISSSNSLDEPV